ncbi:MAG: NADH:flavin oxidoreductase/NADH oxidase [Actinomyces sp.]|jgi:2,4-dienoyl-CoA reductase-like NADH-dependent reductase (Old Yellow Enzyme family)|nr:NADH:flavin oxidoreductase/NADH oxidase [Actinomyces sp.]MCI1787173.1 NADH:flavin oxidoreductase/NADH oxidase [Actinomyces sp.]MCI1829567.1 NADH:flavin oxidoreductase/NADH oxidase [Actinomyces sp.]MCI1866565.1 NADH:flavin oxidoreductase/NADH oxidase [Actinomyces sp.]
MPHAQLFTPVSIAGLTARNRLWMPPMCMYSAAPLGEELGRPTPWHQVHYGARAIGGAGAVIVEATGVVPEGRISVNCLSLHDDAQIPSFSAVVERIHAGGAAAFIQLNHAGRKGSSRAGWLTGAAAPEEGGWQVVAPSPIPFDAGSPTPRELTEEEILGLVGAFADAAGRAIEAGFDGVQIHAAHGYLIHQFLSPASNRRADRWGGGFEGRTRFVREVVRAVRARIGDAPVLVRISATDWTQEYPSDGRPGWTLADTERLAPLLARDGASMLNVSTGGNVPDAAVGGGVGYQVFAAAGVRRALGVNEGVPAGEPRIPVSACGLIVAPEQAEQILVGGDADVIEIGRVLLSDPMAPMAWAARLHVAPDAPRQYLRATRR